MHETITNKQKTLTLYNKAGDLSFMFGNQISVSFLKSWDKVEMEGTFNVVKALAVFSTTFKGTKSDSSLMSVDCVHKFIAANLHGSE